MVTQPSQPTEKSGRLISAGKASASGKKQIQQFGTAKPVKHKHPQRIGVFFTEPAFDDYPFNDPEFRLAYEQLGQMITDAGGVCAIVRDPATYRGKGIFQKAWIFETGSFHPHDDLWTADVIYNKCKGNTFAPTDVALINPPELERLCTDKWETYQRFSDLFPETLLVQNTQELEWALTRLDGELIVAKPLDGEGGEGITIASPDTIAKSSNVFPLLLQTFLDTSDGIPDIAKGMHDLRIFVIGNQPMRCYVRQPKKGSYLANYALGGSLFEIPLSAVPAEAMTLFLKVDALLHTFPHRVYCVDMGRDKSGKWKLIELNSKPGLDPIIPKYPTAEAFMKRLVDLLLSIP